MVEYDTSRAKLTTEFPAACEHCGYSLRGSRDVDRCPECGAPHGGEALVLRPVAVRRRDAAIVLFAMAIVLFLITGVIALMIDWPSLLYAAGSYGAVVFILSIMLAPAAIFAIIGLILHLATDYSHTLRLTNTEIRQERYGRAKLRISYTAIRSFTVRSIGKGRWVLQIHPSRDAPRGFMVVLHSDGKTANIVREVIKERIGRTG